MTRSDNIELAYLLSDIVYWRERVAFHLDGMSEEDFARDITASDAVCWCLGCVGEAAGTSNENGQRFKGSCRDAIFQTPMRCATALCMVMP
jgi:uncharacterized protein with HEPN domain